MTIEFDSYLYMTVVKRFSLKDMGPRWAEMAPSDAVSRVWTMFEVFQLLRWNGFLRC